MKAGPIIGAIVAGVAALLLLRPKPAAAAGGPILGGLLTPEPVGTAEWGPIIHGPVQPPAGSPATLNPETISTRCPPGGDGSKICPFTGVLLPYDELVRRPELYYSPTGLSPDAELEAINRYRLSPVS